MSNEKSLLRIVLLRKIGICGAKMRNSECGMRNEMCPMFASKQVSFAAQNMTLARTDFEWGKAPSPPYNSSGNNGVLGVSPIINHREAIPLIPHSAFGYILFYLSSTISNGDLLKRSEIGCGYNISGEESANRTMCTARFRK